MGADQVMRAVLAVSVGVAGPGQQLLWEFVTPVSAAVAYSFGDLDRDGYDDVLAYSYPSMRVLSGADGSVLDDRSWFLPMAFDGVGDFDGDGYPDYAMSWDGGIGTTIHYVEVWSPHLDQQLMLLTGLHSLEFGSIVAGDVDFDGDRLPDLLVCSTRPVSGSIRAYSHSGAVLYEIPIAGLSAVITDAEGLKDLDGDGCSDFLIGGLEANLGFTRGFVALLSGRRGTLIHISYDEQRGDKIGRPVRAAGDMDRDGVQDYATGNYWGPVSNSTILVYSGATGAVIRRWRANGHGLSGAVVGGLDADLDGVVDVISASPVFDHPPPIADGRVFVFSSRDGQELLHIDPTASTSGSYALDPIANLGVQPGSPYPVFAVTSENRPSGWRIEVFRCSPAGVSITGTGCSSHGPVPTVSVRRVETPTGDQSRIVLGSAPASALAWCAFAPAGETSFAGLPLPLALDPYGFVGCSLLVPANTTATRGTGSTGFDRGYAEVNLDRPLAGTGGLPFAAQWLLLDPATGGFATTPRCEFRVPQ